MILIIMAAMVICLAAGFYAGWISAADHAEHRQLDRRAEAAEAVIKGRHARSWPLRTTGELAALYGGPYPHPNGTQP